jgi:hypothetical protein
MSERKPLFFTLGGSAELYKKYGIDPITMTPMEGINVMLWELDKKLDVLEKYEARVLELEKALSVHISTGLQS